MNDSPTAPPARGRAGVILAAVGVTAIWGFNFVVIAVGLQGVPPLLLAALRFLLAAVPAVFFVPFPRASWKLVAAYGLALGVGEFGLLFTAMAFGAPAGLSSIILQAQAFFTAILAAFLTREPLRFNHAAGMVLAFGGLALIALAQGGGAPGVRGVPVLPFVLLVLAALLWALANIIARKAGPVNALGLMVWSSLASPLPLLGLSLWLEGPALILDSLRSISLNSVAAIAYLAFISTLAGYGVWNHLIARRGAAAIAPFSLLVPVFGVSSAALCLGERLAPLHLAAAGLILAGLAIHVFGGRLGARVRRARA
jgi:O-acetylserine/cysteine efflux transporter